MDQFRCDFLAHIHESGPDPKRKRNNLFLHRVPCFLIVSSLKKQKGIEGKIKVLNLLWSISWCKN